MNVKKINHIAIVVPDINEALGFWRDTLGLELSHVEEVPEQGALVAFLPTGDSEVELVEPTTDTSSLAKSMAKRGPGMHHICLEVENLEEVLTRLEQKGVTLIDTESTVGARGRKVALIHPKSTGGVLVELYE